MEIFRGRKYSMGSPETVELSSTFEWVGSNREYKIYNE